MTARRYLIAPRSGERISFGSVLSNWAALVALWALPYLTLLDYLRVDAAQSQLLQWSLVAIGAFGVASLLFTVRRHSSRDPRGDRGLAPRR